ncbi:sterol desaturase family protein [Catenuloplanes indicus]|uniref:Sterol desaturase/sphingolipid hydroxylase (Fatty acid hydroxylase superfamily) n=1 Tax=Catenuloplanes indicus TaxID=137267 RepID=A0AAE3VXF0_9ACTN|nr:sterol desaturase family protein [Catenuloplanes indicus]MDQ0364795.1 sterol desaturase/sphingolipid hydroxylase (fatty acid hydroxylase superfamily) [Catenuloplanes indicus]
MDTSAQPGPAPVVAAPAILATGAGAALRVLAYPVLLAAMVVTGVAAPRLGWDLGIANFLFLLGTIAYFATLERLIPYEPAWHPSRREWRSYGIYFLLTLLGGGIAQFGVSWLVNAVAAPVPALPPAAEIPLALLAGSLGSYVMHRLGHTNRWLWKLHGIHHLPDKVNVGNNGVSHVLDIVLAQGAVQLALALAGFSEPSVFLVGLFVVVQGYFTHANIDVRIGWLNRVLASPEQHRLHHSTDLAEAGNYGSDLSIWDQLFGSFTWRPGRRPAGIGVTDPGSFPPVGAIGATLLHPLRGDRRY